ncbi:MAG: hypothetical protein AVDCRST_MAG41-640, partial [uncultured Corynebacteriales bacterium]
GCSRSGPRRRLRPPAHRPHLADGLAGLPGRGRLVRAGPARPAAPGVRPGRGLPRRGGLAGVGAGHRARAAAPLRRDGPVQAAGAGGGAGRAGRAAPRRGEPVGAAQGRRALPGVRLPHPPLDERLRPAVLRRGLRPGPGHLRRPRLLAEGEPQRADLLPRVHRPGRPAVHGRARAGPEQVLPPGGGAVAGLAHRDRAVRGGRGGAAPAQARLAAGQRGHPRPRAPAQLDPRRRRGRRPVGPVRRRRAAGRLPRRRPGRGRGAGPGAGPGGGVGARAVGLEAGPRRAAGRAGPAAADAGPAGRGRGADRAAARPVRHLAGAAAGAGLADRPAAARPGPGAGARRPGLGRPAAVVQDLGDAAGGARAGRGHRRARPAAGRRGARRRL